MHAGGKGATGLEWGRESVRAKGCACVQECVCGAGRVDETDQRLKSSQYLCSPHLAAWNAAAAAAAVVVDPVAPLDAAAAAAVAVAAVVVDPVAAAALFAGSVDKYVAAAAAAAPALLFLVLLDRWSWRVVGDMALRKRVVGTLWFVRPDGCSLPADCSIQSAGLVSLCESPG